MNAQTPPTEGGDGTRIEYMPLGLFVGSALFVVAGRYETLKEAILEAVQNALDKKARNINIALNHKTNYVAIRDNGNGVGPAEFKEKLATVCRSLKLNDKGSLGRFGMGLIAPLGKCREFTFTSCEKGASEYLQWTFNSAEIEKSQEEPSIPCVVQSDLVFRPQGAGSIKGKVKKATWWRSQLVIHDYKKDKLLSRIDSAQSLVDEIKRRYRLKMLENDTVLTVKFTNSDGTEDRVDDAVAERYSGKELPPYVVRSRGSSASRTDFELYLAIRTKEGQGGQVEVGVIGDPFAFEFETFVDSVPGVLPKEVVDALTSGIFEGVIRGDKVELESSRKSFKRSDAVEEFCKAIVEWYEKVGKAHVTEISEARREERWQNIMRKALGNLQELLKDNPSFAYLRGAFDNLSRGRGSRSSTGTVQGGEGENVQGVGGAPESATPFPDLPPASGGGSGGGDSDRDPKAVDESSIGASGPDGKPRRSVKHGAFGLQLSTTPTEAMLRSNVLFMLDVPSATLHFNTRHPTWEACDTTPMKLQQMQETAIIFALTSNAMPESQQAAAMLAFETAITPLVAGVYHNSDAFVLSKRRRES